MTKQAGREIDLLLLTDPNDPEKTHYVWIKDLTRMLHKNSKHEHRKHPCRHCLHVFSSETLLENHKNDCQGIGEKPQRTEMPKEGQNILRFTNHHKQMRAPYIIYADFEALNIPIEGSRKNLHTADRKAGPMQLLLCSGSQRWRSQGTSAVSRRRCCGTLPNEPSCRTGRNQRGIQKACRYDNVCQRLQSLQ